MCLHNHTFIFLIQLLDIDDDSEVVTINVTESSGLEISSKGMYMYIVCMSNSRGVYMVVEGWKPRDFL